MQNIPKCRLDFERNINLFVDLSERGKINFVSNEGNETLINSLIKVRPLPNQRINFLTVDEKARIVVNSASSYEEDIIVKK